LQLVQTGEEPSLHVPWERETKRAVEHLRPTSQVCASETENRSKAKERPDGNKAHGLLKAFTRRAVCKKAIVGKTQPTAPTIQARVREAVIAKRLRCFHPRVHDDGTSFIM
jgi:hypothetical protein